MKHITKEQERHLFGLKDYAVRCDAIDKVIVIEAKSASQAKRKALFRWFGKKPLQAAKLSDLRATVMKEHPMRKLQRFLQENNMTDGWLSPWQIAKRADLRGVNLRGAYLEGANLSGADLEGVDIRGADLWDANLSCTNFQGAVLRDTCFNGAYIRGADFRGACLQDADLHGTHLLDGDLLGATGNYNRDAI